MSTGVHIIFQISFQVSSDTHPELETLGHKAVPFLIFWGNSILLSMVAVPICIPTNSAGGFPFLHPLSNTCCLLIYWWWPSWPVWSGISLWFWFASLWWLVTLSTFLYVYRPSVCPLFFPFKCLLLKWGRRNNYRRIPINVGDWMKILKNHHQKSNIFQHNAQMYSKITECKLRKYNNRSIVSKCLLPQHLT